MWGVDIMLKFCEKCNKTFLFGNYCKICGEPLIKLNYKVIKENKKYKIKFVIYLLISISCFFAFGFAVYSLYTQKPNSNKPVSALNENVTSIKNSSSEQVSSNPKQSSSEKIIPSGLNEKLMNLIAGSNYSDTYNKIGIEKDLDFPNIYIVTDRFSESILGNIKIGSPMQNINEALGKPDYVNNQLYIYKIYGNYIGFYGTDNLQLAVVTAGDKVDYDYSILDNIIKDLAQYNSRHNYNDPISEIYSKYKNFFNNTGHIEGGGTYAVSNHGINLSKFDGIITLEVYKNFNGDTDISQYKSKSFEINFYNYTIQESEICSAISDYEDQTEETADGIISPNKKIMCSFVFVTGEDKYFIIHYIDNSQTDKQIQIEEGDNPDFAWINNTTLLYIDDIDNSFYSININTGNIHKIYEYKLIGKLTIKRILSDEILLTNEDNGSVIILQYNINGGEIKIK